MKRVLGLDLGTTSIGWAVVDQAASQEEKSKIIQLGVRVNPITVDEQSSFENGKSITTTADRTLKRGMRRSLQRYKQRREHLVGLLKKHGIINDDTLLNENGNATTFQTYRLRAKAAHEEISLEEFARVLLMINKKRGYKSNRTASVSLPSSYRNIRNDNTLRLLFYGCGHSAHDPALHLRIDCYAIHDFVVLIQNHPPPSVILSACHVRALSLNARLPPVCW